MSLNQIHFRGNTVDKAPKYTKIQCADFRCDNPNIDVNKKVIPLGSGVANTFLHTNSVGDALWKAISNGDITPGTAGHLLRTNALANAVEWVAPLSAIPVGTVGQVLTTTAGPAITWADPVSESNPVAEYNRTALPYAPVDGLVLFDNTVVADANLPLAANVVTVAEDGLYEIQFHGSFLANDATTQRRFEIQVDGVDVVAGHNALQGTINMYSDVNLHTIRQLTAGQTIGVENTLVAGAGTLTIPAASAKLMNLSVKKLKN